MWLKHNVLNVFFFPYELYTELIRLQNIFVQCLQHVNRLWPVFSLLTLHPSAEQTLSAGRDVADSDSEEQVFVLTGDFRLIWLR